tara:strand:+ start:375 stop:665 length:291 start_codon:yes stop_codon:yes gene_type:complete
MTWEDILKADKKQSFLNKLKEVANKTGYNALRIFSRVLMGIKLPTFVEMEIRQKKLLEEWNALSPEEQEEIKRKRQEEYEREKRSYDEYGPYFTEP